jgi:hypothetical protein
MTRRLARHPLDFLRGEEMDYGVPGAANNTGGGALAFHRRGIGDAKYSASCPGLTRASMMNGIE